MDLLDVLANVEKEKKEEIQEKESGQDQCPTNLIEESNSILEWESNETTTKLEMKDDKYYNTIIRGNIEPEKLVWAKNNWFSLKKVGKNNAKNYFPARLCDHKEMLLYGCDTNNDQLLVEFINIPSQNPSSPQKAQVRKQDICPYYINVCESSQKQTSLMDTFVTKREGEYDEKNYWNRDSVENMRKLLTSYYSAEKGNRVNETILSKANKFLSTCLEYEKSKARDETIREVKILQTAISENTKANTNSKDDASDISAYIYYGDTSGNVANDNFIIKANCFIEYRHHLFSEKKVITRVLTVSSQSKAHPLILENGESLNRNYKVRVLKSDGSGYNSEIGSDYVPIKDFKMISGTVLESEKVVSKKRKKMS